MIPAWVEAYIGVPFKDRGRDLKGLDCYGLLYHVYRYVYGVEVPSYEARYETAADRVAVAKLFFQEATSSRWRRLTLAQAEPPDALTMTVLGVSHVGLLVAPERFLHVLPGRETCVERLRPHWQARIEGVYRHEALVLA
jgi:cell wall-associated NlpC family hydrolase